MYGSRVMFIKYRIRIRFQKLVLHESCLADARYTVQAGMQKQSLGVNLISDMTSGRLRGTYKVFFLDAELADHYYVHVHGIQRCIACRADPRDQLRT